MNGTDVPVDGVQLEAFDALVSVRLSGLTLMLELRAFAHPGCEGEQAE